MKSSTNWLACYLIIIGYISKTQSLPFIMTLPEEPEVYECSADSECKSDEKCVAITSSRSNEEL